jgi:exocyst complex component 3
MVSNLLDMDDKLVNLEYMLDVDSRDLQGPNEHLLMLHFQLNQLETFRNETTYMAKKSSADVRNTLQQYFTRLSRLIDAFDAHIVELARNILPLVKAGHSDVVVKLLKIAEVEGKADEKVIIPYLTENVSQPS